MRLTTLTVLILAVAGSGCVDVTRAPESDGSFSDTSDTADGGADAGDSTTDGTTDVIPDVSPDVEPDAAPDAADSDVALDGADGGCQVDCAAELGFIPACGDAVLDPTDCSCSLVQRPDLAPCDDGDRCTVEDRCDGGVCRGEAIDPTVDCDDGEPCTLESCDQDEGCQSTVLTGDCEDGDSCTQGETCQEGVCGGATGFSCGTCDINAEDTCEAEHGDGDLCNGVLACDGGFCKLVPGSKVECADSGEACLVNTCEPSTGECGLVEAADASPCSDGTPCTSGDACLGGSCVGVPTGAETCQCLMDADCASLEDGDQCNGVFRCSDGTCTFDPSSVVTCDPAQNTACISFACDPGDGKCKLVTAEDDTPCSDGKACTVGDVCGSGFCEAGPPMACDQLDGACVEGICDNAVGCVTSARDDGTPCSLDDKCVSDASCDAGLCVGSGTVDCDDGDDCTVDTCDAALGCVNSGPPQPDCPTEGVCAGGVPVTCDGAVYACDLMAVAGYSVVEQCDEQDNDCDGETDEDCATTVGCGVGTVAADYGGAMQACTVEGGVPFGAGLCAEGWHLCTYSDLVELVGQESVPDRHWIAASVSFDSAEGAWSAADTMDGTCAPLEGGCGATRTVQAMSLGGVFQEQLSYAAEAWGCKAGVPEASCETATLDGAMCCMDLCQNDGDCDDDDACTVDTCVQAVGRCESADKPAPTCPTKGVCAAGVPLVCMGEQRECDLESVAGWQASETLCDGLDNDCDGLTDAEDPDLGSVDPPACEKTLGVCAGAVKSLSLCAGGAWQACTASEYEAASGLYEPGSEVSCDGEDNNCDGAEDEAFASGGVAVGGECEGAGACGSGIVECAADGISAQCSTELGGSGSEVTSETCNGVDDDCDGQTDEAEDLVAPADICAVGVCVGGVARCDAQQQVWVCDASDVPGWQAVESLCDELDNDCDGDSDEGFEFAPDGGAAVGKGAACGEAPCEGVVRCSQDGGALECSVMVGGGVEVCDGVDNDCNGETDDGITYEDPGSGQERAIGEACSGLGACSGDAGTVQCGAGNAAVCQPDGASSATPEVCNDIDDDCDGQTDEGMTWQGLALGATCVGAGVCGEGKVVCGSAAKATCSTNADGPEYPHGIGSCNGLDDDCDGQTDEADEVSEEDSGCLYEGVCTPQNVTESCTNAGWSCDYSGAVAAGYQAGPETGLCDGLDNNCDGFTDEAFPTLGQACDSEADADLCEGGVLVCSESGEGVECAGDLAVFESCGGGDEDCDGSTDEADAAGCTTFYKDGDGDGYGTSESACLCKPDTATKFTATVAGDCDDEKPAIKPGAGELCNGVDDDCDGKTDAADAADLLATDPQSCEIDKGVCAGVSKPSSRCVGGAWQACTSATYLAARPSTFESPAETRCDGLDNDCDGLTDADDEDLDDQGPPCELQSGVCQGSAKPRERCIGGVWKACEAKTYADYAGELYEAGEEQKCDGLDNDCDGQTDDPFLYGGLSVGSACDGVGACGVGQVVCVSKVAADCSTNPGAPAAEDGAEVCNGADDDCDGATDEDLGIAESPCFKVGVCSPQDVEATCVGGGWSCDYGGIESYEPAPEESCEGLDNDCDGATDEALPVSDGVVGDRGDPCGDGECLGVLVCNDDGDGLVCSTESGSPELCDGQDNDCNGSTDEGLEYADPVLGGVPVGADCNGRGACGAGTVICASLEPECSSNVNEAVAESCNGVDDDCDGATDEGFKWQGLAVGAGCDGTGECGVGTVECRADGQQAVCSTMPLGSEPEDEPEVCDGLDDDCDGQTDDGLGYADSDCRMGGVCTAATVTATCAGGMGWMCDYLSPAYSEEGEAGLCDALDNDCEGQTDEDFPTLDEACDGTDADLCELGEIVCAANGAGTVCVESEHKVELCSTAGVDDDCDGQTDEENADDCTLFWVDADEDGWGAQTTAPRCLCEGKTTGKYTATVTGDCDDSNPDVSPGDDEVCDEGKTDENCDGATDEADAEGCVELFFDGDGDGFGDLTGSSCRCEPTDEWVVKPGDCCDVDERVFPGQTGWFTGASDCGGFDYNCSKMPERQFPDFGSCTCAAACLGCNYEEGWRPPGAGGPSTIPLCGQQAQFMDSCVLSIGCNASYSQIVQGCH